MKTNFQLFFVLITIFFFLPACSIMPTNYDISDVDSSTEILYVYEDGQMKLGSRFIDSKDVVIYADGRGGEKAAVKVRVPIHSDFYRDSILVVRVVNRFGESVSQNESETVDNIN